MAMVELLPGKTAHPLHARLTNDLALYVLSGHGTLRRSDGGQHALGPGDYVGLPRGEASAHQVINTGGEALRYLEISTALDPEVRLYPDSNTVQIQAGSDPLQTLDATDVGSLWDREDTTVGDEPDEPDAEPAEPTVDRAERIEQMVEDDLEALRRKLASEGDTESEPAADGPGRSTEPEPSPAEPEPPLDDLDALKRKLDGG